MLDPKNSLKSVKLKIVQMRTAPLTMATLLKKRLDFNKANKLKKVLNLEGKGA